MTKEQINRIIETYISEKISLTEADKQLISDSYQRIQKCLPNGTGCFLTGSYARHTAIHPIHDLDIIYPIDNKESLEQTLRKIRQFLLREFCQEINENDIELNSHSMSMKLSNGFSVDIVPALEVGILNEYGQPLYEVSEIFNYSHAGRVKFYEKLTPGSPVTWIKSDPKGYIEEATQLNKLTSSNTRLTTKLLKASKNKQKKSTEFELKSFHLEQISTLIYKQNHDLLIIDALMQILGNISQYLDEPCIRDKADNNSFIDKYVEKLSDSKKQCILQWARKGRETLGKLEHVKEKKEIYKILDDLLLSIRPKNNIRPQRNKLIIPSPPYSATTEQTVNKILKRDIKEERRFLKDNYSDLKFTHNDLITGKLKFRAAYYRADKYLIIDPVGKADIEDSYYIKIKFNPSGIPKIYETKGRIEKIASLNKKPLIDMHQYPEDKHLCLAHPLKLKNRLYPAFNLEVFMDEFVVPYFIMQTYFAKHGEWLFGELLHGELGHIQYIGKEENLRDEDIRLVQSYLQETDFIKYLKRKPLGHHKCLCKSNNIFRSCHPELQRGIIRLRNYFRNNK